MRVAPVGFYHTYHEHKHKESTEVRLLPRLCGHGMVLPLCGERRHLVLPSRQRNMEQHNDVLEGLHRCSWRISCLGRFFPHTVLLLSGAWLRDAYRPLASYFLTVKAVVSHCRRMEFPSLCTLGGIVVQYYSTGVLGIYAYECGLCLLSFVRLVLFCFLFCSVL